MSGSSVWLGLLCLFSYGIDFLKHIVFCTLLKYFAVVWVKLEIKLGDTLCQPHLHLRSRSPSLCHDVCLNTVNQNPKRNR